MNQSLYWRFHNQKQCFAVACFKTRPFAKALQCSAHDQTQALAVIINAGELFSMIQLGAVTNFKELQAHPEVKFTWLKIQDTKGFASKSHL